MLAEAFNISARNQNEQSAYGLRPYLEIVDPLSLQDWQIETDDAARRGHFNFVRLEYKALEKRQAATEQPTEYYYSRVLQKTASGFESQLYKGPKASEYKGHDSSFKLVDTVGVNLPEITIARVLDDGWISDIAPLALQHHNTQSALDNVLLYQAYQRIIASGKFDAGDGLVMHEGTVTLLPPDMSVTIVPPTNTSSLENRKTQIMADMFRIAFSQTRTASDDGKAIQSAETQRESKEEFLSTLQSAAVEIEQLVNESLANYMLYKSKTNYEANIKIDTNITIDDLDQQINAMAAFWEDIKQHPTWYKESLKLVQRLQGLEDDTEITKEIDQLERQDEQQNSRSFRENLEGLVNGGGQVYENSQTGQPER